MRNQEMTITVFTVQLNLDTYSINITCALRNRFKSTTDGGCLVFVFHNLIGTHDISVSVDLGINWGMMGNSSYFKT